MAKNFFEKYSAPASMFIAGTMGVGFLSLPYIASQTGIWVMLLYVILLTYVMATMNLIFSEISLRTPDFHRFPGFVRHHLGKGMGMFATVAFLFVQVGVLLAYLIVGSKFLHSALAPMLGGPVLAYAAAYFLAGASIIRFDGKLVAKTQFIVLCLLGAVLLFVAGEGVWQVSLRNILFQPGLSAKTVALPYGALLFSLWGISFIPAVEEMVVGKRGGKSPAKKLDLKKTIALATVSISLVYLLFTLFILGVSGQETMPTALAGLERFLDSRFVLAALLGGALVTLNAFVAQGNLLKETLAYDLRLNGRLSFIVATTVPMILFLLGLNAFIPLVSFIGGIFLSIFGLLILAMYKKIGGSMGIILPLSLVFILGIAYEITYFAW